MASKASPNEWLLYVVGRPLLVVFWALVLWGTLYLFVFVHAALDEGPRVFLQRTLSGRDKLAGLANLGLAILAPVVWGLVGLAIWQHRTTAAALRRERDHRE
jgi:hypothetical protein